MNKKSWIVLLSILCTIFMVINLCIRESILYTLTSISIAIISVILCTFTTLYYFECKKEAEKMQLGAGLIDLGAALNIILGIFFGSFNTIGSLFVVIGLIMFIIANRNI